MNNLRRKNSSPTFSVAKIANVFVLARQNELLQNTESRKIYENPINKVRGRLYSPRGISVSNSVELGVIFKALLNKDSLRSHRNAQRKRVVVLDFRDNLRFAFINKINYLQSCCSNFVIL